MPVAALLWTTFNSTFNNPVLHVYLQRQKGESHSCAVSANMGFRGNKAKEVQTHPFPWSLSEMTHFCSSASFQNRDCFSESTAFVAGPITGVVLFIIHSFCLRCICLRQNSSALKATVRAEIALQIGEIKFSRFSRWRILSFFLFFFLSSL